MRYEVLQVNREDRGSDWEMGMRKAIMLEESNHFNTACRIAYKNLEKFYTKFFIEADNSEDVFRKGNMRDFYAEDIEEVAIGSSVSVGDLIREPNGHTLIVLEYGFGIVSFG